MAHTEKCLEWQTRMKAEHDEYVRKWPNYCRKCEGNGELVYSYDPSPAGVSLGSGFMTDADPCPECSEKGLCPRCGASVPDWDNGTDVVICPSCSWIYHQTPGCPLEADECGCETGNWDYDPEDFEM